MTTVISYGSPILILGHHATFGSCSVSYIRSHVFFLLRLLTSPLHLHGSTPPSSRPQLMLQYLVDLSRDRFEEAFLESAPQAIIQIYIISSKSTSIGWSWQLLSIAFSLASLSFAASDYTRSKYEANPLKRDLTGLGGLMVHNRLS